MIENLIPAPSPLQQLPSPGRGVSLFIKRDDQLHPQVEGSKLRKLAPVIAAARDRFPQGIVTPGGAFSNHLHAVAAAGAFWGFQHTGLIRGEHVDLQNPTLRFCAEKGMRLIPVPKAAFDALLRAPEAWMKGHFPEACFLPMGGNTPEAVESCSQISREITEQLVQLAPQGFSRVYLCVPAGTGCTAAGVIAGMNESDMETLVFPVSTQGVDRDSVEKLLGVARGGKPFRFIMDYIFGGFARFQPEVVAFTQHFYEKNGILLDPVYTAKMCFGVHDMLANGSFPEGSAVVMLHTGGMQGWQGFTQRYSAQFSALGLGQWHKVLSDVGKGNPPSSEVH